MKAIITKYLPATNTRGARITAHAEGIPRIIMKIGALGEKPHAEAALFLARKMRWNGTLVAGGLPDGSEVFCLLESDHYKI